MSRYFLTRTAKQSLSELGHMTTTSLRDQNNLAVSFNLVISHELI